MQADCGLYSSYMNAEKYNLDRIYFGGYFIRGASSPRATRCAFIRTSTWTTDAHGGRPPSASCAVSIDTPLLEFEPRAHMLSVHIGHAATISTLSYAIRFWSKGTKRALFLRHEGFL